MGRKLSVGETLAETFRTYRHHAGALLPVAFWLYLVAAIVEAFAREAIALFPLALALGLAVGTIYQGVVVSLVRGLHEGRREFSMRELVGAALPVLWPLIGAGILSGLGVAAGFVALLVPGLYLLAIWAVIGPVIVVERTGVFDAFGRSRALVRGNGWPVFGAVLIGFLIAAVAGSALFLIAEGVSDGPIVRVVFSTLASIFAAPISALVAAVLYYRLLEIERTAPPAAPEPPAPLAPAVPPSDGEA